MNNGKKMRIFVAKLAVYDKENSYKGCCVV